MDTTFKLIYQTCIDDVRVTVRAEFPDVDHAVAPLCYNIQVERNGIPVNSTVSAYADRAISIADILRDIYWNSLEDELLAH